MAKFRSGPSAWLTLVGERLLVAGLVTFLFALLVATLMRVGLVTVASTGRMIYLAQGLFTGTVTLVTIVLAINQLVLSREFRSPGELHDNIENARDFRHRVEETADRAVMPTNPTDFFSTLLDGTLVTAQRVGGIVDDHDDADLTEEIDELVSTVTSRTETIADKLETSDTGLFETLAASLAADFSQPLAETYRVRTAYSEELSDASRDELDDLATGLEQIDIARQYFKSLYIQTELADLSWLLLYAGLPAISGSLLLYLIYVGGPSLAVDRTYLPGFVLSVLVLCFLPIAILFSFVLRIAVIAERTVAITPFTMPTREPDTD